MAKHEVYEQKTEKLLEPILADIILNYMMWNM